MRLAVLSAALLHLVTLAPALRLGLDLKDILVIVRTHAPASGMQKHMQKVAREVKENLPTAHFLVSVDDTHLAPGERWVAPFSEDQVHRFVWDDVRAHFPLVDWGNVTGYPGPADGKTFHMEPVLLAVEWAKTKVRLRTDAAVWVLEDDVLVCGKFSDIVEAYAGNNVDFLTGNRQSAQQWRHREFASAAFLQRYGLGVRFQSPEFVERFSLRFLQHIEHLSREEAVSAQSEMFAPTVCASDTRFVHSYFKQEHLGLWHCMTHVPAGPLGIEDIFCQGKTNMNHAAKYARIPGLW